MSENCSHNCAGCKENCSEKKTGADHGKIAKIIGVLSGKGGVGKSFVTALLAAESARRGLKTAVLDADITGPSIPKLFGIENRAESDGKSLLPAEADCGVKIMSANMLLESEDAPVLWRGPVISGLVGKFMNEVAWGDTDIMFIDMPPGTGDVALTVFQSFDIDGVIIVTSPQDLVTMIAGKAVAMAAKMNIPVIGAVENYSYFVCPDCGKKHRIYGGQGMGAAERYALPLLARLPIDPSFAKACDEGRAADVVCDGIAGALDAALAFQGKKDTV